MLYVPINIKAALAVVSPISAGCYNRPLFPLLSPPYSIGQHWLHSQSNRVQSFMSHQIECKSTKTFQNEFSQQIKETDFSLPSCTTILVTKTSQGLFIGQCKDAL